MMYSLVALKKQIKEINIDKIDYKILTAGTKDINFSSHDDDDDFEQSLMLGFFSF